jgi:serine/threonine-protein kinase
MTLAAGKRLGSYEILALIGVGGMGEVYRARDTRLDRIVAVKILPDDVAHDPDFRQRFEREARTISSLSHPHICTLYDIGSENGVDFLVMELLEGETLAQRLAKGALPFPQVLRYGIEIAEALERAHRQGVTHRDLKPGNIMITKSGAKLLDFGLAKLKPASPVQLSGAAATAARDPLTASGTILGTLQYMAPEQVESTATDHRADVFAFGAIVYEMATGKKAFDGASQASLIGAILKDEPRPISTQQPLSPPGFDALIATCLAKDPDERWQSAGDVARQLKLLQSGASQPSMPPSVAAVAARGRGSRRPWPLALGAFAIGLAVAGTALYYFLRPGPPLPKPVVRIAATVNARAGTLPIATMSADGRRVAFQTADSPLIQVRDLDDFESRAVPGTAEATLPPCFSPDGEWIAYGAAANTQLKKMPVAGGTALTLVEANIGVDLCHWGSDGFIYFGAGFGISRVPQGGGPVESVAEPDIARGEQTLEYPQLLPGGDRLLFSAIGTGGFADVRGIILSLATGERRSVLETGSGYAAYASAVPTLERGYLLYPNGGALFAAPLDLKDLTVGAARPVVDGVLSLLTGVGASQGGTIAYYGGNNQLTSEDSDLVWIARDGGEQRLPEPPHGYGDVQISPDGRQIQTNIFDVTSLTLDLWVYDLEGERLTKLTFGGANAGGIWTPDGRRLLYTHADSFVRLLTSGGELRSVPVDQSAAPEVLLAASDRDGFLASSISPDGAALAASVGPAGAHDVVMLTLNDASLPGSGSPAGEPRDFLATSFDEQWATFSPDGRYLAYSSDESGRAEVYVVPYPGPGGKTQVSRGGGDLPRWNPAGGELFYVSTGNELMAAPVQTTDTFRASTPRALFTMPPVVAGRGMSYDVAADGTRFLVRRQRDTAAQAAELRIVVNLIDEIERGATAR